MFDIKKIDPEEFSNILDHRDQYQIVDVNEEQDQLSYRLNIHHIPFSELEENLGALDKNRPLVLICKFGERSFFGASLLINNHGFKDVLSLTGGLKVYSECMEEKKC